MKQRGWPRKLDDEQAQRIREWYAQWSTLQTARSLARELGVDTSLLYRVGKGLSYKQSGVSG